MRRKTFAWLFAALFALSTILAACGGGAQQQQPPASSGNGGGGGTTTTPTPEPEPAGGPQKGGTLSLILDGPPDGFNPYVTNDVPSSQIQGFLFEGLLGIKPDGSPYPIMLEELPTMSPDGKTWSFTLKKDLKWSDGNPITVDDVVFTFESVTNPNLPGSPIAALWAGRTIEKTGDYTFDIHLPEIKAGFLISDAGFEILPKHILGDVPVTEWPGHEFNLNPTVFSGPYVLADNKPGQEYTLKANPHYVQGEPNIETVVMRVITDQTAAVNAVLTGEADFVALTPDTLAQAQARDNLEILSMDDLGFQYIGYNLGTRNGEEVPFFKDVRVRYAIEHAVDKDQLVRAALEDQGVRVDGYIVPVQAFWYNPDLPTREYDPEKAKQLLDEAGWVVGADGIREKDGVKFDIKLPVRAGMEDRIRGAQVWANYLKEVGIKVEVTPEDFNAVMLPRIDPPFDFDAIWMGWGLTINPDPFQIFHSENIPFLNEEGQPAGGSNFVQWVNPKADEVIMKARTEPDDNKRREYLNEFQQILYEDPPYHFMYARVNYLALNKRFQGPIEPSPWGRSGWGTFWNIHEWWVEE